MRLGWSRSSPCWGRWSIRNYQKFFNGLRTQPWQYILSFYEVTIGGVGPPRTLVTMPLPISLHTRRFCYEKAIYRIVVLRLLKKLRKFKIWFLRIRYLYSCLINKYYFYPWKGSFEIRTPALVSTIKFQRSPGSKILNFWNWYHFVNRKQLKDLIKPSFLIIKGLFVYMKRMYHFDTAPFSLYTQSSWYKLEIHNYN